MKCPFCAHPEDKVIDSRESREGELIRRRRECLGCARRFTTYERIDEIPYMVIKKDGRREKFDRQKLLSGLLKACEKRPVGMSDIAGMIDDVENRLAEHPIANSRRSRLVKGSWKGSEISIKLLMCASPPYIAISRMSRHFSTKSAV